MIIKYFYKQPYALIKYVIIYLITAYLLIYLMDFRMAVGDVSVMINSEYATPFLWVHLFSEGSLTEIIQWTFLGLSLGLSAFYAGMLKEKRKYMPSGFLLLSLGLLIMFMEDTGNFRHLISDNAAMIMMKDPYSLEWKKSLVRTGIEMSIYAVLGIIMLSAFYRIIRDRKENKEAKIFLAAGFLLYGVAAFASATRNVGDWYIRAGTQLMLMLDGSHMIDHYEKFNPPKPLGFWFMDFVLEETIELLGAVLILTSIILFVKHYFTEKKILDETQRKTHVPSSFFP